ncbi:MAG: CDP-diacylglycerol--glycerol-3-phosphate 3-phosphatidyltransferase [Oscillospiraceae bacterium]|nr:CDP-diacylglycerol--glycerol-3-phosphate 3-phosphatidyltransferase [Oscillospiraceae bacterium]
MNLPNKLTILRILMIPLFIFFFFEDRIPYHNTWALLSFAAAALTDLIDGKIARSRGLITDFGKLMDPLADKLLTTAAFCCLFANILSMHVVISFILILSREFLVTSVRLVAAGKGEVLAADIWGKIKTVMQMSWICLELLGYALFAELGYNLLPGSWEAVYRDVMYVLLYAVVAVTVLSGAHYIVKNRHLFNDM